MINYYFKGRLMFGKFKCNLLCFLTAVDDQVSIKEGYIQIFKLKEVFSPENGTHILFCISPKIKLSLNIKQMSTALCATFQQRAQNIQHKTMNAQPGCAVQPTAPSRPYRSIVLYRSTCRTDAEQLEDERERQRGEPSVAINSFVRVAHSAPPNGMLLTDDRKDLIFE